MHVGLSIKLLVTIWEWWNQLCVMWWEMCQSHWPAWSKNLFLFQGQPDCPGQAQLFSFGEYAQYYWSNRLHTCAYTSTSWEWMGVYKQKGEPQHQCPTCVDADLIITNCVVKWPGSVHDARILRESALYRDLQTNRPDGVILGDSAYPLLPWLMTPFLTANTPAQARFNTAQCRARCAIERLNGVLKRRFACLNYLRAEPQKACNITLACIVLHNIATKRNVPLCADNDAPEPLGDPNQPPAFCQNEQQDVQQGTQ